MSGVLQGKRIVNTRALHQAGPLDRLLEERGAIPLSYPCIAIEPPANYAALDHALRDLVDGQYRWLIFTSSNTVQAIADRLVQLDCVLPESVAVAVVGPSTAIAMQEVFGRAPRFMPDRYDAEALAAGLPMRSGEAVLAPGSDIARPELARILAERGATVTQVVAYRTITGSGGVDLPGMLRDGTVDALTFASPSAVQGFVQRLAREGSSTSTVFGIPSACIGETTREAAAGVGLEPMTSATQTIEDTVEALERRFAPVGSGGTRWS
jgi:uroporphyrinogen-III synthase